MEIGLKEIALGLLITLMLTFGACNKEEEGPDQKVVDREKIEEYVLENNLDGKFTDSGLYYIILNAGNNTHPSDSSRVTVKYKGYYLSGSVFEKKDYYTFNLIGLIDGWKEGLPLIGEGGEITLIMPGHLAYNDGVRAFDITLFNTTK